MAVHHDFVYQHLGFGDVLSQLEKFLAENPSEFVLMREKEDYTLANNNRTFEDTFHECMEAYSKIIYKPSREYFFQK